MSIRLLFPFLTAIGVVITAIALWFLMQVAIAHVTLLFPGQPEVAQTVSVIISVESAGFFTFGLVVSLITLFVQLLVIDKPLRTIAKAMEGYSERNELVNLPDYRLAPREVRVLRDVFLTFVERVDAAHKNDVEMSRVKSDFISTAAHQLRTPLTGIRWALEALEKTPISEDQATLVKSAVDKSHDLVAIVGTLLDISSIESGKYKYVFNAVDLGQLAGDVTHDFAPLSAERKISLFFAKGDMVIPPVRADRDRIKWVINNLIENAIHYTPEGGTVRVTIEASQDRVYLKVRDTGIGISANDRGNIFERFYRAPNAVAKEASGGSGLGLYIARTIATDHGGDLNFETNKEGPGTTFTLSLPLAA